MNLASRSAAAPSALARSEGERGALAQAARSDRKDLVDTPTTEAVFTDVAFQQGMILEHRDDDGVANYRLVPRGENRLPLNDAGDCKLTLEDVETILINQNPA